MALQYGTVEWHVIPPGGDTQIKGEVTFTLKPRYLLAPSANSPSTILPAPVVAGIDQDGDLCYPPPTEGGAVEKGVRLIATDEPSINPQNWSYEVHFRFEPVGGRVMSYEPFNVLVPANQITDLSKASRVPSSPGTGVVKGDSAYEIWLAEGNTGTVQDFFDYLSRNATFTEDPARPGVYLIGA